MPIKLIDSKKEIIRKINEEAINIFKNKFYNNNIKDEIEEGVQHFILKYIRNTKVWQSLLNGGKKGLDAHFGIPREQLASKLESLLSIWANEISIKAEAVKFLGDTFIMTYKIEAIRADWADVLSSDAGVTWNYSRNYPAGLRLPWLEWLLVSGDQLVIDGYTIDFGDYPSPKPSRSGKAIMRPKLSWRIPTGFGPFNSDNNFITRALAQLAEDSHFHGYIETFIEAELEHGSR